MNCPHWDLENPDSSISSSMWWQNLQPSSLYESKSTKYVHFTIKFLNWVLHKWRNTYNYTYLWYIYQYINLKWIFTFIIYNISYNFCTEKIHGYGDSTESWPTSDRQDESSTIESETQRPRQTRFQHFSFSDPNFFSRACRHLRARTKTSWLHSPVTGSTGTVRVQVLYKYRSSTVTLQYSTLLGTYRAILPVL